MDDLGLPPLRRGYDLAKRLLVALHLGTAPNPAHVPTLEVSREAHEKLVTVAVASGRVATYDLTVESIAGSP